MNFEDWYWVLKSYWTGWNTDEFDEEYWKETYYDEGYLPYDAYQEELDYYRADC